MKETDRIEAVTDGLQALGARIHSRPTAGRSPASRRGCAAGASTRAATTGSPCSAPSPALASREGVAIEGADTAAISFPGFYELLER